MYISDDNSLHLLLGHNASFFSALPPLRNSKVVIISFYALNIATDIQSLVELLHAVLPVCVKAAIT